MFFLEDNMKYRIITISREFGAGGHTVGKELSGNLGIPVFDGEIIKKVAMESGLSEKFIEEKGEYGKKSVFENYFSAGMYYKGPSLEDEIWAVQTKIIRELAEKEPCIIIGRCADFILKERDDVLDVFLHASCENRIKRLVSEGVDLDKKPEKFLKDRDCRRSSYVHFYTDMKWGEARNYDMSLDTGKLGIEKCAELIESVYKN